ncbi:hypothetical protein FKO01_04520 [Mesorhizobium sp. B2-3-3]|nr:hypothetical protein FKO01_04520 [Mesorhizobium sp. B2-3-3]
MRYIFAMWAGPMAIFWGWFYLSANDINFGYVMFTRHTHDFFFQLYGQMLGIDPSIIPGMVAKTCIFDGLLLMALWAFRRRREIWGWIKGRTTSQAPFERLHRVTEAGPELPAE